MIDESIYPKVSVIMPSYNHKDFVLSAIESIECQTYPNVELIIVDDASSDGSQKVIADHCENKPHIVVFKTKNTGVAKTINEGLALAGGKYIAFFASDDVWHPEKIHQQVDHLLKNYETKIVFTEGEVIDEDGNHTGSIKFSRRSVTRWTFADVLRYADLPAMSPMVRTSEILACGGFPEGFEVEDFAMWCVMLQHGGYASVLPSKLTFYRIHGANTHIIQKVKVLRGHFNTVEHFSRDLSERKSLLAEWGMRNANMLARNEKMEALRYFLPNILNCKDVRYWKILWKLFFIWK